MRTTAGELSLEIVTIHVDTPEALARQRLIAKRNTKSRLDVTEDEFAHILRVWEPPTADEHPLTFHAGEDMENWISRHRAFLAPE